MPPFFSMPCLFICTSEYRIVYAMSFPSTWKWFWKCQSCLLYSVITCLLFDFIISSASGKTLGEAKHLSGACQLMNFSGKKSSSLEIKCHVSHCGLLKGLPTVCRAAGAIQAWKYIPTLDTRECKLEVAYSSVTRKLSRTALNVVERVKNKHPDMKLVSDIDDGKPFAQKILM